MILETSLLHACRLALLPEQLQQAAAMRLGIQHVLCICASSTASLPKISQTYLDMR